ncbi:MAG: carboxypeptidase-like regulatory domain-containing protein [Bacteroidota bacterium]
MIREWKRFYPMIIGILCTLTPVFGQDTLRGQVIDSGSRIPLSFVTVFFDGTTIGELTDEDGRFELPMRRIQLPAVLSVSHIGYEPWQMEIADGEPVKISLQLAEYEIKTVHVDDADGRAANVKEFLEQFMGVDRWGRESTMEGTEYLFFERNNRLDTIRGAKAKRMRDMALPVMKKVTWSEDGSYFTTKRKLTFTTRSRAPLLMDLPHLGYKVQVDLRELYLDYEQGMRVYTGAFFFMPYEEEGERPRSRHRRNREQAYYGSIQHFLRALYRDELTDEGYEFFDLDTGLPYELDMSEHLGEESDSERDLQGLKGLNVGVRYYHNSAGRPVPPNRLGASKRMSSLIIRADSITIRADGTFADRQMLFGGDMGAKATAWLLPADYEPSR